jgi:hypothetical protein
VSLENLEDNVDIRRVWESKRGNIKTNKGRSRIHNFGFRWDEPKAEVIFYTELQP